MSDDTRVPRAVRWHGGAVRIIDQTVLPAEYREIDLRELDEVVEAIRNLRVRGAPAIGIAAAMGLVASLEPYRSLAPDRFRRRLAEHAERIRSARPTAANLGWAVDRIVRVGAETATAMEAGGAATEAGGASAAIWSRLEREATRILDGDRGMCRRIGKHGLELLGDGTTVLTHCNTGALATGGIGTAVAPIYLARELGRRVRVVVTETRPLLQGSRLTAWELQRAGVDVVVISDSAAAATMRELEVDMVIVGADRIVANGDVANKIGTYGLAIAARHQGIPFYVAAPTSSIDFDRPSGAQIPIEERAPEEISLGLGRPTVPDGVEIRNPAFDVTPAVLVDALVSEHGIVRPPYIESLAGLRADVRATLRR